MTLPRMLGGWADWFRDPPPPLIFEISEESVCLARLGKQSRLPDVLVMLPGLTSVGVLSSASA